MPAKIKSKPRVSDINSQILANLGSLQEAHRAKKPLCFAKGLPFYTCIDAERGIYSKELHNGKIFRVIREIDEKTNLVVDTIL